MTLAFLQTPPGDEPVIVEGTFKASPERVFEAWTKPDVVMKWFGRPPSKLEQATIDLRVGGTWRFAFAERDGCRNTLEGEYLAIEAGRRLVFSWVHVRTGSDGETTRSAASRVTVSITPSPEGTIVRLVHEAIATEDGRIGVGDGWHYSFALLQKVLEG